VRSIEGPPAGNTVDLRQLKTKNEKLKSQNGSCVLRTGLLTPSAEKKAHKHTQMNQQFLTRTLFFAEGVLKSHEVRNFRFSFFIFNF
jgi:hypothetical protein